MRKKFVVVGAGLGGLAIALRLAHRGHQVTIVEKTDAVGGRNRHESVNDCKFDGGPSLLMMLDPFKKLFTDVGERFEDHLQITLLDPSYRVFFRDGSRIDGTPNVAQMLDQIERLTTPEEAARYPQLLGRLAALYHDSIPHFVRTNYSKPTDIVHPAQLARVAKHGMLGNLAKRVQKTFKDPRLQMLFSFQTMYLGLSPYQAPWVYATLTYMEYGEGIWYPQGGLPAVTDAVANLARRRGVEIRLQTAAAHITPRSVTVTNPDGSTETLKADAVISNADLPYTQTRLEPNPKASKKTYRYSCSAYVVYLDYQGQIPELLHHNVFFGKDYAGNLESIFTKLRVPEDPAFYACLSNRSEPSRSPAGHENLFLLIPCPNLDHPWTPDVQNQLRSQVFARLAEETSFDPARVRGEKARTPIDWKEELNLEKGAAFGISHDLFQSAFFRPGNKSKANPGLYYVGASTVPGNGLPMVLISAELCEKRLIEDRAIQDAYHWPPLETNQEEPQSTRD